MNKNLLNYILFAISIILLPIFAGCRQTSLPPSVTATSALVIEPEIATTPVQPYPLVSEMTSTPISAYPVGSQPTATSFPDAYPAPDEASPTPEQASTQQNEARNEDELVQAINQRVIDIASALETLEATTTDALEDEAITQEDVDQLIIDAKTLALTTEEANALIERFTDQFGGLASESLPELQNLRDTLGTLSEDINAIETTIATIQSSLESGSIDQNTINELQSIVEELANQGADLQLQVQGWLEIHQEDIQARMNEVLETEPTKVAENLEETNEMLVSFITNFNQVLEDNIISEDEFNTIVQDSANLLASLEANGGPLAPVLEEMVKNLASQVAAGNLNEVAQILLNLSDILDLPSP